MSSPCDVSAVIDVLYTKVGVPHNIPNIDTASWEELGVESLGLTEVCSSLELMLNVHIPHEQVLSTRNLQELLELVNSIQC